MHIFRKTARVLAVVVIWFLMYGLVLAQESPKHILSEAYTKCVSQMMLTYSVKLTFKSEARIDTTAWNGAVAYDFSNNQHRVYIEEDGMPVAFIAENRAVQYYHDGSSRKLYALDDPTYIMKNTFYGDMAVYPRMCNEVMNYADWGDRSILASYIGILENSKGETHIVENQELWEIAIVSGNAHAVFVIRKSDTLLTEFSETLMFDRGHQYKRLVLTGINKSYDSTRVNSMLAFSDETSESVVGWQSDTAIKISVGDHIICEAYNIWEPSIRFSDNVSEKYSLVFCWFMGCGYCWDMKPSIDSLNVENPEIHIVGLCLEDKHIDLLKRYVKINKYNYPNFIATMKSMKNAGIYNYPTVLLLDPSLKVAAMWVGYDSMIKTKIVDTYRNLQ